MLIETPHGGADLRTHVGVSRKVPLSMAWLSVAPGPSESTPENRGHTPRPRRATARTQTGLTAETCVLGQASSRPTLTVTKGARHVTRP